MPSSITHCWCFYLDVYAYIEVLLKLQLKCLILGVYTCFYLVGNWHIEAFQEIEEEFTYLLTYFLTYLEHMLLRT